MKTLKSNHEPNRYKYTNKIELPLLVAENVMVKVTKGYTLNSRK